MDQRMSALLQYAQAIPEAQRMQVVPVTCLNDTLAALQAIINLNLVGQLQVVGFGVTDTIVDYLDRGVLDSSIAVNPQRIGIESVRVLSELMTTGNAPGYVDTGVEIIEGSR